MQLLSGTLVICLFVPATAQAFFYDNISSAYISNRSIRKTTKYLRKVDLLDRKRGVQRRRTSDAPAIRTGRSLRQANVRFLRTSSSSSSTVNKARRLRSPLIRTGQKPSVHSKATVSRQTQTHYLNGIRYANGTGVGKNLVLSYMWLKFALSDGHPLAREALRIVSRRMTQSQIQEAEDLTKKQSVETLLYDDYRPEIIRDSVRERDLQSIARAFGRYKYYHDGRLPRHIRNFDEVEICRPEAVSCLGRADLRFLVPDYLLRIPEDPMVDTSGNGTGYFFAKDEQGLILYSELGELDNIVVED